MFISLDCQDFSVVWGPWPWSGQISATLCGSGQSAQRPVYLEGTMAV